LKILANSLHAGIWSHSFPEELVLRSLSEQGHDVTAIRCNGELNKRCVTISGMGVKPSDSARLAEAACRKCRQRRKLLEFRSSVHSISLDECLLKEDMDAIDESLKDLTPSNWSLHEFLGHNVARATAYEFVLEHKLNSLKIPETLWPEFVSKVRSAGMSLCAAVRMLNSLNPDLVITYNSLYSVNNVVSLEARRRGIRTWAMHSGHSLVDRYERLYIYDSTTIPSFSYETTEWSQYLAAPLDYEDSAIAVSHFLELLSGSSRFTYSKALEQRSVDSIKTQLDIPAGRKILLATLTSGDEAFAAELAGLKPPTNEPSLFNSTFEWLEWLIQEMPRFPECHLVIRVHPREMPNKRDGTQSQNASVLRKLLANLPPSVSVNWPDDEVSLYELAQITDVCVNFTSSAGIEMMMLGIPTVIPHNSFMAAYAPEISLRGRTHGELSSQIRLALARGWSVENTRLAMKWWGFLFRRVGIDISDRFRYPSTGYTPIAGVGPKQLASNLLFKFAISGPPIVEFKHLLGAGRLRHIQTVTEAFEKNKLHVIGAAISANAAASKVQLTDRDVLKAGLSNIFNELSRSWDPNSRVLRSISQYLDER
jgi:hypothetical protein